MAQPAFAEVGVFALFEAFKEVMERARITNWRDVGGNDQRVVAYSRENNSGTYVFFKEHVRTKISPVRFRHCLERRRAVANAVKLVKAGAEAIKIEGARLLTWQAAWLVDQGLSHSSPSAIAKCYASDMAMEVTIDAVQVLGGYGYIKEYPVEKLMRDAKVNQLGAGTSEVMRMVLYRQGVRSMADELKMPHRHIHPKLGVPISTTKPHTMGEANEGTIKRIPLYDEPLVKYPYAGRSFTPQTEKERKHEAYIKIVPSGEISYQGKIVAIVDDSIVRGSQTREGLIPKLRKK
jgi:hypothetical protein